MGGNSHRSHVAPVSVDRAIEECIVPRRNFYLGLWAGRQLGITQELLRDYACSVVVADFEEPGYEDLFRKLARDFSLIGLDFPRDELERQLRRAWTTAVWQFAESD